MALNASNVIDFKPVFEFLRFDPTAERSVHFQAGGFVWSDEKPEFHVDGEFPVTIPIFMIYLISYRATLMAGEPHEAFTPIWNEFESICPNWPGFRPERNDPALFAELESELDAELAQMERMFCERRKRCREGND